MQKKEEKGIIILDDLERRIYFEKKQNQLEIVELKKQSDAVKNSGQSKKVLNKNVLKAKKALDRKEKLKSKTVSKLTKQLDQQDKIKKEKNKLLLELNQSFSSSDFNVEQMKKLALKELAIEESKLKNLKNMNSYKQSNHVQTILLFYRIIENKISQSSFDYYEILGESHPLS